MAITRRRSGFILLIYVVISLWNSSWCSIIDLDIFVGRGRRIRRNTWHYILFPMRHSSVDFKPLNFPFMSTVQFPTTISSIFPQCLTLHQAKAIWKLYSDIRWYLGLGILVSWNWFFRLSAASLRLPKLFHIHIQHLRNHEVLRHAKSVVGSSQRTHPIYSSSSSLSSSYSLTSSSSSESSLEGSSWWCSSLLRRSFRALLLCDQVLLSFYSFATSLIPRGDFDFMIL